MLSLGKDFKIYRRCLLKGVIILICLSDLSPLMQRTIEKGITFMISQSGVPNYYNLYFAKYIVGKGNKQVRLTYHHKENKIYQYADENHPVIPFENINDVLDYVDTEIHYPL